MTAVRKRSATKIWFDVIFALFTREIRVGFNDKLGLSWAVIQPIVFILLLSFLRGRIDGGETHGIHTFIFMAFGLILIQFFLQTFSAVSRSFQRSKPLFAFRQVQPLSAVIACGLFELLAKIFVILGLWLAIYFLGIEVKMVDPIFVILIVLGLWLFSMSIGLIFGIAGLFVPEMKKVEMLMTRPLFFISGVFFSLKDIPQEYWYLLDWNPILHAIELARFAAYPEYGSDGVSVRYLSLSVLIGVFAALVIYQRFWKQAISR